MITSNKALKVYQFIKLVGCAPEPIIYALTNNAGRNLRALQRERVINKYVYSDTNWYVIANHNFKKDKLYSDSIRAWFTLRWLQHGCTVDNGVYISKTGQQFELSIQGDKAVIISSEYCYTALLDDLIKNKKLNDSLKEFVTR
jgi:hypothetical protein